MGFLYLLVFFLAKSTSYVGLFFVFFFVSRLIFEQIRSISLGVYENQLRNSDRRVTAGRLLSFRSKMLVLMIAYYDA